MGRSAARAPSWPQFVAWALCGASAALILVAAFAITPVTLVLTAVFAFAAVKLGGANISAVGTASGAGIWGFVLGWLNRDGPGQVCTVSNRSITCIDEWSPWPFWLAGCLLVIVPIAFFTLRRRSLAERSPA